MGRSKNAPLAFNATQEEIRRVEVNAIDRMSDAQSMTTSVHRHDRTSVLANSKAFLTTQAVVLSSVGN
jgi:hypothetical protein